MDSARDCDGRAGGASFGLDLRRRGVLWRARVGAGVSFGAAGGVLPGRGLRAAARVAGVFGVAAALRRVGFEVVFAVGLDAGGAGAGGGGADSLGSLEVAVVTFRRPGRAGRAAGAVGDAAARGRAGVALGGLAAGGEVGRRRTVRDSACSGAEVLGPAAPAGSGFAGVGVCGATSGCAEATAGRGGAARARRAGVFPAALRRAGDGAAVLRLRDFMAPVGWGRKASLNCDQQ